MNQRRDYIKSALVRPTCNYMTMGRSGAGLIVLRVVSSEYNWESDGDLIMCRAKRGPQTPALGRFSVSFQLAVFSHTSY